MRAHDVQGWLAEVRELDGIVGTLRNVAAAELHRAERELRTARVYRAVAEEFVAVLLAAGASTRAPAPPEPPWCLIVYTSALGLCGDFNDRMLEAAERRVAEERAAGRRLRVLTIGARAEDRFAEREDVVVLACVEAPTSVEGLSGVIERVACRLAESVGSEVRAVEVLGASFDGPGRFAPSVLQLVPPRLLEESDEASGEASARAERTWFYQEPAGMLADALQEHVFATLYATLAETLAAEHGARLVATQQAHETLEEEQERLGRLYRTARQQEITSELLEVAAAAAALRA